MASVELYDLFIHNAADLTDFITIDVFGGFSAPEQTRGEVRTYSAGRRRVVRRPGRSKTITATFPTTRERIAQFEEWVGETVMLRDPVGRLIFGVYFEVGQDETDGGEWVDVSLVIEEITYSVAV